MDRVFENTGELISHKTGKVDPYINAESTGLPVVCDTENRLFETLASFGTPVPVPEGLETTRFETDA